MTAGETSDDTASIDIITLSIILPLTISNILRNTLRYIVLEKELKLTESAKIMGMTDFNYFLSIFLYEGMFSLLITVMLTLVMYFFQYLDASNALQFLVSTYLFALGTVSFAMMVSTLFTRAAIAIITGFFLYYIPTYIYAVLITKPAWAQWIFMFNSGFAYIGNITFILKGNIQDSTVYQPNIEQTYVWLTQFLLIPLYMIGFLFFERTIPNEFGVKKGIFCCFNFNSDKYDDSYQSLVESEHIDLHDNKNRGSVSSINGLPKEYSVIIKNMGKVFGDTVALDNLNLKIESNQIFSILGHNGAGKTTTLNLLMGMFQPDKGTAKIYNKDIRSEMEEIRLSMGVCQQFDVLYDDLSVYDHLKLAHALKNIDCSDSEIAYCCTQVGLNIDQDKDKRPTEMSGGMKRKLSLSMSLVGDPRILFLDEPTSAMDTEIRSQVRNIIRQMKSSRTIILTTQHMDEAEELSDNIALLSKGKLRMVGSVDAIKKQFGVGYNLILNRDTEYGEPSRYEIEQQLINNKIKDFEFKEEDSTKTNLKFILPFNCIEHYPALFECLEQMHYNLSVQISSLEETFINFMNLEEESRANTLINDNENDNQVNLQLDNVSAPQSFYKMYNVSTLLQIKATVYRRVLQTIRDCKVLYLTIFPCVMIAVSLTTNSDTFDQLDENVTIFLIPLMMSIYFCSGFSFGSGVYIYNMVKDRQDETRYLQNINGIKIFTYWIGNMVADLCLFLLPLVCLIVIYYSTGLTILMDNMGFIAMLTFLFGCQMITMSYVMSFMFSDPLAGLKYFGYLMFLFFVLLPFLLMLWSGGDSFDQTGFMHYTVLLLITLSPYLNFFAGMFYMGLQAFTLKNPGVTTGFDTMLNLYNSRFEVFIPMVLWTVIYFACTVMIDSKMINYYSSPDNKQSNLRSNQTSLPFDQDTLNNINILNHENMENERENNVEMRRLCKTFPNDFTALHDITLDCRKGEILGLLGPNGAGKSTTFNILTLKECKSTGVVKMLGKDLHNADKNDVESLEFNRMGICPQANMLFEVMTVEEHFYFYSMVKGLDYQEYLEQTEFIIHNLALTDYRYINARDLSGGNKRKLMCGLCILSCPSLTFLDEPTTGVDPVARMKLRGTIKGFSKLKQSSYIFTTHWMQEAEQLCDRVCILINGRVIVVGTPDELRRKYGEGYSVEVYITDVSKRNQVIDKICSLIPTATVQNNMSRSEKELLFKVKNTTDIKLSKLFKSLNDMKQDSVFKDFSLSQSSLEQVFLMFARHQQSVDA